VLSYYNGKLGNALEHLFPTAGIDVSKFTDVADT